MCGRFSRIFESGWETLPDVREVHPNVREVIPDIWEWLGDLSDVREWSGGLPVVRKWSGGPPGYPGMVRRPSRMSGSGRQAFPDV